jgi:ABC-type transport system involved in cytochrome c biogenesis permease subunit
MQHSSPGSTLRPPLQRKMLMMVFGINMLFAKLLPSVFHGPLFLIASRPSLHARTEGAATYYQAVVAKHDASKRNMRIAAAALVALLAFIVPVARAAALALL